MTATLMSSQITAIRWADIIDYSQTGGQRKILMKDGSC